LELVGVSSPPLQTSQLNTLGLLFPQCYHLPLPPSPDGTNNDYEAHFKFKSDWLDMDSFGMPHFRRYDGAIIGNAITAAKALIPVEWFCSSVAWF
jgi:hypothetical protein